MNNLDETIKRILLNMNYDSRKTLSENTSVLEKYVLLEEPKVQAPMSELNSMNMYQIMAFQYWVWTKVDKNPDTTPGLSGEYNKTKYSSILCSQPCASVKFDIPGNTEIEIPGAIDGGIGELTKKAWTTYGELYKKSYPNWSKPLPEDKFYLWVLGKTAPLSSMQEIKNFQKWFLEHYEKKKPDAKGLVSSMLCLPNASCTVSQAVDGYWDHGTKNAWVTAGTKYKTEINTKAWYKEEVWTVELQAEYDKQQALVDESNKQKKTLSKIKSFYENPSGWNGVAARDGENPRYTNANDSTYWKEHGYMVDYLHNGWGWNYNTLVYPAPVAYTNKEINEIYSILTQKFIQNYRGEWVDRATFNKEKDDLKKEQIRINSKERDNTNVILPRTKIGDEFFGPKPTPQEVLYAEDLKRQMLKFNNDLSKQSTLIPQYCKPIMLTDGIKNQYGDFIHRKYISPSEICLEAGGLWAYQIGDNVKCGCRDQTAPSINYPVITNVRYLDYVKNTIVSVPQTLPEAKVILGFQTEARKPFDPENIKDWAKLVTEVTMPLTFVVILAAPLLGVGALTVEAILLSFDLADAVAYMILGDPYAVGLSLTAGIIGAPNLIKQIPSIGKFTNGDAGSMKEFIKKFSDFLESKGAKFSEMSTVAKEIIENSTAIKALVNTNFAKKIKPTVKLAKNAVESAKHQTKLIKHVLGMSAESYGDFIKFVLFTKNAPISIFRNLVLNFVAPFITWDVLAYNLGFCRKMDMSEVEKMYNEAVKIENKMAKSNIRALVKNEYGNLVVSDLSPLQLTEEDKKILDSKPWKLFVYFANTIDKLQMFTNTCEGLKSLEKVKELMKQQGTDVISKQLDELIGSFNNKIKNELEEENFDSYSPSKPFDEKIYYIQLILIEFLNDHPDINNYKYIDYEVSEVPLPNKTPLIDKTGIKPDPQKLQADKEKADKEKTLADYSKYSNTQYGSLDGETESALRIFKVYSGLEKRGDVLSTPVLNQVTVNKLIDYLETNPEELLDPVGIDFGDEEKLKQFFRKLKKESEKIEVVEVKPEAEEDLITEAEKMDNKQKEKFIKDNRIDTLYSAEDLYDSIKKLKQ